VRLPDPVDQLCGSRPFAAFCRSALPTADQRVICRACGLEVDESGHLPDVVGPAARGSTGYGVCRHPELHQHEQLEVLTPPEQMWEQMGRPAWEAPYVGETNYVE